MSKQILSVSQHVIMKKVHVICHLKHQINYDEYLKCYQPIGNRSVVCVTSYETGLIYMFTNVITCNYELPCNGVMLTAIGVIFYFVDKLKFYILYRDYKALPG